MRRHAWVAAPPPQGRRPCANCGRPTALAALVETHLPAPPAARALWAADWVVWLCPACVRGGIRIPTAYVRRRR